MFSTYKVPVALALYMVQVEGPDQVGSAGNK